MDAQFIIGVPTECRFESRPAGVHTYTPKDAAIFSSNPEETPTSPLCPHPASRAGTGTHNSLLTSHDFRLLPAPTEASSFSTADPAALLTRELRISLLPKSRRDGTQPPLPFYSRFTETLNH